MSSSEFFEQGPGTPIAAGGFVPQRPPATATPMATPALQPFVFAATGRAYFRIWIVNLLLSIVTIGIYSAWAKVRRVRYFYGNTLFDGSPFEFHGRPMALLRGRLIGVALLAAYSIANRFSVVAWFVVAAILIALMPWLLWKSLRFRMANSSYRGIHFGFDGTVGQAYLTFVPLILMFLVPAFLAISMREALASKSPSLMSALGHYYLAVGVGLLFAPWFYFRLRAYQHRHARLGTTPFSFDGKIRSAYWIAFKLMLLGIAFAFIASIPLFVVMASGWSRAKGTGHMPGSSPVALYATGAFTYLLLISGFSQGQAMIQNYVWKHSSLGGARFESRVGRTRLWWIFFSNLVLTLVTLGFYWPFAVVQTMRYRIGALAWSGDSNGLAFAAMDGRVGATGEETADLFGLDIAL